MENFISKTSYGLSPKVFVVGNPKKCYDFNHLIGEVALIDGLEYLIKGVESRRHGAPWKEGEDIGLAV